MTRFEPQFFKKFKPTAEQLDQYFQSALRDFSIAREDEFVEVQFSYCYQCLIKAGIALLAKVGSVRVRSVPGHHVKILEKMSEILKNPDIDIIGNSMRTKRNLDLYEGGTIVSESEVEDFLKFVQEVVESVRTIIYPPSYKRGAP